MKTVGIVKWFNKNKGHGFITSEDSESDIFLHHANIIGDGYKNVDNGDVVLFLLEDTKKGLIAKEIEKK
jgi:CspA family cold shock protein